MGTCEFDAGNLNTHLAFNMTEGEDPRVVEARWEPTFLAIEAMNGIYPSDVLNLPETAIPGQGEDVMFEAQWNLLRSGMQAIGYSRGIKSRSPRPDGLVDTLWVSDRLNGEGHLDTLTISEGLVLPRFSMPGAEVVGLHNPSNSERARVHIASEIVAYRKRVIEEALRRGVAEEDLDGFAVLADFNAASSASSKTTRVLHSANAVVSRLPGVDNMEFFRGPKLKRLVGVAVRACAMTQGTALQVMEQGGLVDAAGDNHQPTVHMGLAMQVDRIFTSGLTVRRYAVIPARRRDGSRASDHDKVAASMYR